MSGDQQSHDETQPADAPHRAGMVTLIGRPNVGKSTMLNALIGAKVAIVTPKPQTTRTRILGVSTRPGAQFAFLDTPGMHAARSPINRRMVATAERAASEADVLVLVVDATRGITPGDRRLAKGLVGARRPVVIALNKIDKLSRGALLPLLGELSQLCPDRDIVPVSARKERNLEALLEALTPLLPEGPPYYEADTLTDQTERTLVQEVVREQVLLQTSEEVPYAAAVVVDTFERVGEEIVVAATINVERPSQKGILIGSGASRVKAIGIAARRELTKVLGAPVSLQLHVRVQQAWSTQRTLLEEFGL
jgi:GTP-binding protein Era